MRMSWLYLASRSDLASEPVREASGMVVGMIERRPTGRLTTLRRKCDLEPIQSRFFDWEAYREYEA